MGFIMTFLGMIAFFIGFIGGYLLKIFLYFIGAIVYLSRLSFPLVILFLCFYFVLGTYDVKQWTAESRGFFVVLAMLSIYGMLEQFKKEEE